MSKPQPPEGAVHPVVAPEDAPWLLDSIETTARIGHWRYDVVTDDLRWSPVVYEIFGVDPDTFVPKHQSFLDLVHPEDEAHLMAERQQYVDGKADMNCVHRIVRPDGEVRWVIERARVTPPISLPEHVLLGTVQDITHLRVARSQLVEQASEAAARQERVRRRLSRRLHDDVGGRLAALRWQVGMLGDEDDRNKLTVGIDVLLSRIRALAFELRPAALDTFGLDGALDTLAERLSAVPDCPLIDVEVGHLPSTLAPQVETAAYRAVEEALSNVLRHAGARSCEVAVEAHMDRGELEVRVQDDGQGFESDPDRWPSGGGLWTIAHQAEIAGGRLSVRSKPGQGTTLLVHLPLEAPRAAR